MNGETSREEKIPNPSSSTPASPPTEPSLAKLAANAKIKRTAWLEAYGVPISQEFAEFIEAIGLLIQAASVRAASTGTGWISGWESGRDDAAARLCEEIISWESEARCNDTTSWEKDFINKRIGQIKTHIAQIREIPLPAPPVASQKGKEGVDKRD